MKCLSLYEVNLDFVNVGRFDYINQMIALSALSTLSGFLCISDFLFFKLTRAECRSFNTPTYTSSLGTVWQSSNKKVLEALSDFNVSKFNLTFTAVTH